MRAVALVLTHFSQRYPQATGTATPGHPEKRSSFRDIVVYGEAHVHFQVALSALGLSGASVSVAAAGSPSDHWVSRATARVHEYFGAVEAMAVVNEGD